VVIDLEKIENNAASAAARRGLCAVISRYRTTSQGSIFEVVEEHSGKSYLS
jgi:hypothetical protein